MASEEDNATGISSEVHSNSPATIPALEPSTTTRNAPTAGAETQSQLLNPQEFSRVLFSEITQRKVVIKFKQLDKNILSKIAHEIEITADELFKRGHVDANILFSIRTDTQDYNGADKSAFFQVFDSSKQVTNVSISLAAKLKTNTTSFLIHLVFTAAKTDNPNLPELNEIRVSGDDTLFVKNTHARLLVLLQDVKTSNRFLYSGLTEFLTQMSAVIVIFALSVKVAQNTKTDLLPYPQVFAFAAMFLLLSNSWTFILRELISLRRKYFPVVGFENDGIEKWLLKFVVFAAILLVTWSGNSVLNFISGKLFQSNQPQPPATQSARPEK